MLAQDLLFAQREPQRAVAPSCRRHALQQLQVVLDQVVEFTFRPRRAHEGEYFCRIVALEHAADAAFLLSGHVSGQFCVNRKK